MVLKSWSGARSYSPEAARRSNRTCSTTISASLRFRAPQRGFQMIQRVVSAHRHQDVAGLHAHALGRKIGRLREIELVELACAFPRCLWSSFRRARKWRRR